MNKITDLSNQIYALQQEKARAILEQDKKNIDFIMSMEWARDARVYFRFIPDYRYGYPHIYELSTHATPDIETSESIEIASGVYYEHKKHDTNFGINGGCRTETKRIYTYSLEAMAKFLETVKFLDIGFDTTLYAALDLAAKYANKNS